MSIQPRTQTVASADSAAVVGVDLGVRNLLVAAPADAAADVEDALVVEGEFVRALYDELGAVTRRLQTMTGDTRTAEAETFCWYHDRIMQCFARASARVLDYLHDRRASVVVLEDLTYPFTPLEECRRGEADVGSWLLPAFQRRLAVVCEAAGYSVEFVDPEYTTQECHGCGVHGERLRGGRLKCINDACPVDEECRDKSAAVSIGQRSPATMEGV